MWSGNMRMESVPKSDTFRNQQSVTFIVGKQWQKNILYISFPHTQ